MSSNLQTNRLSKVPLSAKFGLHYGYLGALPTLEELVHIKSLVKDFGYQLLSLDISSLITKVDKQRNATLQLSVPTLGFTDPAFDYEVTPWFAVPLVINGFVSKSDSLLSPVAQIYVTDIINNQYLLAFDTKGRVDYPTISVKQATPIYSTLQSIQYHYRINALSNNQALQQLSEKQYQGKILLLLPEKYSEFHIECTLLSDKEQVMVKEYAVVPTLQQDTIIQTDAKWKGDKIRGSLQINYESLLGIKKSNAFEATLTISLPQAENLQYLLYGSKDWLSTHKNKMPCLTQYYGLSASVLFEILQVLIPYNSFCQNISSNTFSQKFESCPDINNYSKNSSETKVLYQYLLSGVINGSVPLYALKSKMDSDDDIFNALKALDIKKWSMHDQVVYQSILTSIEQVTLSTNIVWDTLDSYFSFGLGEVSGKLLLETQGVKLDKKPKISMVLKLNTECPSYPIFTERASPSDRYWHLVDTPTKNQSKKTQNPKRPK